MGPRLKADETGRVVREIKYKLYCGKGCKPSFWGFIDDGFRGIPSCSKHPMSLEEKQKRSKQFTGLKDSNGNEIYEGDILKYMSMALLVHVEEYHGYRFMIGKDLLNKAYSLESEIIGNVHENPELLDA